MMLSGKFKTIISSFYLVLLFVSSSCAVMLEIIRIMVSSSRIHLHNDIIFLFNGAEEVILTASHGFITQHKWAPDVKVIS